MSLFWYLHLPALLQVDFSPVIVLFVQLPVTVISTSVSVLMIMLQLWFPSTEEVRNKWHRSDSDLSFVLYLPPCL